MATLKDLPDDQKNAALDWLESLPNHPEVGKDIKRLLKKANPAISYPELDLEDQIHQATSKQAEELAALKKELADKENKEYWGKKKSAAIEAGLITEEEVGDFHKWMVDEHLGNYERAAKMWHDEKHAAAVPTNYQEKIGIQLPSNEGLFQNPIQWSRNEALKTINEINRQKAKGY